MRLLAHHEAVLKDNAAVGWKQATATGVVIVLLLFFEVVLAFIEVSAHLRWAPFR